MKSNVKLDSIEMEKKTEKNKMKKEVEKCFVCAK